MCCRACSAASRAGAALARGRSRHAAHHRRLRTHRTAHCRLPRRQSHEHVGYVALYELTTVPPTAGYTITSTQAQSVAPTADYSSSTCIVTYLVVNFQSLHRPATCRKTVTPRIRKVLTRNDVTQQHTVAHYCKQKHRGLYCNAVASMPTMTCIVAGMDDGTDSNSAGEETLFNFR